ncbi:thioredoxin [Kordia sp. SMS9]|uniref:TlpA family protein disulfide reductase n=1 Tax=Kordia sp. SMS9 TaxID=2282170 RepID=UPI000E0DF2B2|nr:TlpA disulfide reductase family protein [Kordia sp. SMS9]AXG70496.1 thioredoxin [Kordia sp. SMS9]
MTKFSIVTLLCVLCFSCASDTKTEKNAPAAFIVENISEEKTVKNTAPVTFIISNTMRNEFVSVYRNLNFDTFSEDKHVFSEKPADTIQLAVNERELVYISSKFSAKDTLHVKNGDTIYLNLKDKQLKIDRKQPLTLPEYTLRNDEIDSLTKTFYYIDYKAPFNLQSDKYQKMNPIFPLRIDRKNFKMKSKELVHLSNRLVDRLTLLNTKYDSLRNIHPEKTAYYNLLKDELNYAAFFELNRFYSYSKNEAVKDIIASDVFFNDRTITETILYKKLNTYIEKVILKNKRIKQKFKRKVDYKTAFDSLPNYIKNKELLALGKIVCIYNDARQNASKATLNTYIENFSSEFPDEKYESYLQKIQEDYGLSKSITSLDAATVYLTDTKETSTQLDTFLQQHKGKLVYVDFWASWCAPCRAVMPDSKALAKEYAGKEVVFSYVSIDRNKAQWKKAVIDENLNHTKSNFLATNYTTATFFKELKINTIPRYLLFDTNGKLIHENAPGPDSAEIRKLLNQHLN